MVLLWYFTTVLLLFAEERKWRLGIGWRINREMRIEDIHYEHRNVHDVIIFEINAVMKRVYDIILMD